MACEPGRDDALAEFDGLLFTGLLLPGAGGFFHLHMVGIDEPAQAAHHGHLAHLRHCREPAGEFAHHLGLVRAQLGQVDRGLAETHAQRLEMADLVHDGRHVQQGFGGDAADVQADATKGCITLHQHHLHAEIGGAEGGRVAARTRAQHQHVAFEVDGSGVTGRRGRGDAAGRVFRALPRGGGGSGAPGKLCFLGWRWGWEGAHSARRSCRCDGLDHCNDRPFRHLVTELDLEFADHAGVAGRNLHRCLVAFDRDQRLLGRDGVARLDQQFDHGHAGKVADVGHLDFDQAH